MKNVTYTINKHTNKKLQEKRTQPVIISQCVIIHSMYIVQLLITGWKSEQQEGAINNNNHYSPASSSMNA